MSKKNKGSSAKKNIGKKAAKPVKKNSATKKAVKKSSKPAPAKKSSPKKAVTKVVAKKSAVNKIKTAPKPIKKAAKAPLKNNSKPLAKKAATTAKKADTKPAIKTAKPVAEKKPSGAAVVKAAPKKEPMPQKVEKPEEKSSKPAVETKTENGKVLAISNTIPKQEIQSLSQNKIASISSSITNPVKKNDSYSIKMEKEPAGKFELEIPVRSSPEMLFEFLSTPSGLSEWFCDDVNIRNGIYTFIWDGQLQQARLLKTVDDQLVRFQWVDKTDGSYFEFKIQRDDLTNDISLIVTDFADNASEKESSKRLWQSQVEKLMHIIGSIF